MLTILSVAGSCPSFDLNGTHFLKKCTTRLANIGKLFDVGHHDRCQEKKMLSFEQLLKVNSTWSGWESKWSENLSSKKKSTNILNVVIGPFGGPMYCWQGVAFCPEWTAMFITLGNLSPVWAGAPLGPSSHYLLTSGPIVNFVRDFLGFFVLSVVCVST